jgi:hypothetical protein
VRSDAKASSAGSTSGQGTSLGSFVRGAFAIRGGAGGADGSGARGARSIGAASARLLTVLCLSIFATLASSALAAQTHPYTGVSFGPDGVGGSANFESAAAVAVDPVNGDVYVYDSSAGKIYKFDSTGAPVNFPATGANAISGVGTGGGAVQIALAPAGSPGGTGGDIYVANTSNKVGVYSAAGAKLGELKLGASGSSCGLSTDPSGNLFVGVGFANVIKYTPTANPPKDTDKVGTGTAKGSELCNVAVDGLGNIYVAGYVGQGLYKLEGLGDTTPTKIDSGAATMAVAPGSNDLYARHGDEIVQYDSDGTEIGRFGEAEVPGFYGIGVNSGASKIYVPSSGKVKVFGAAIDVPEAKTEAADEITKTTADLHGTVSADGGPDATCVFQYVSESDYFSTGWAAASEKPCSPAGPFSGSSTTAVSATATGLSQQNGYRVRLLATNANGTQGGTTRSFVTPGPVNVHTGSASNITSTGATLNGTVNPEGVELDECFFKYQSLGVFGAPVETVPCAESPATIGTGNTPVAVHADITGLEVGAEYEFWFGGTSQLGASEDARKQFKTAGPSLIKAESIDGVGENGATFHATINPNGVATSYLFEYVTQAAFEQNGYAGAASVPAGGKSAGAGTSGVEVSAQVEGLAPLTTYRFRLVATSADGVKRGPGLSFTTRAPASLFGPCPNDAFRSGFGALLPDCRAYERATPADKGGFDVEGFPDLVAGASDGSGATFSSTGGSSMPASGGGRQDVSTTLVKRGGDSWSIQRLLPPETLGEKAGYLGSSQDMRFALVEAGNQQDSALYLIDTANESLTQVVPTTTEGNAQSGAFHYDAISTDGSRLFFESEAKLTPSAVKFAPNLYMWDRASGQVSLAGVLPAGEGGGSPPRGSFGGAYAWPIELTETGGATRGQYVDAIHAASPSGDQIYFTSGEAGQLYLRRGLAGPSPSSVRVSAPEAGVTDPNGPLPAAFQEATPDGAHAFFLSSEKLTADASTGEFAGGRDLYRYDEADGDLVDITGDQEGPVNPNGARVQGLLGASADGTSGYFAARGKLTPGASADANNIYRFEEAGDGSFDLTYVGVGGPRNWAASTFAGGPLSGGGYQGKEARVSPDGRVLVFKSEEQIQMYREETGKVNCVSCNPAAIASLGAGELTAQFLNSNAFTIPNVAAASRLTHSLSQDGNRVFFQTPNSLLGADTNGSPCTYLITRPARGLQLPNCIDTYEWEAVGTPGGSCTKVEFNGGCLYLLSTGKSEDASYFMDASSDGSSVFIATTSQLVPADHDQLYDVYDVRTGGGLASQQFVPGAPCVGEACRTGTPAAPSSQTAGSASFRGPGNAKANTKQKRCGKKSQKCAKKKKKKKAHKKKGNNKQGHARSNKGDR